jgi:hypothetical protein
LNTRDMASELSSSSHSFLQSSVTSSLRFKYSPQHSILNLPHPTFLLQCDRTSFIPIQNNMQNYS